MDETFFFFNIFLTNVSFSVLAYGRGKSFVKLVSKPSDILEGG